MKPTDTATTRAGRPVKEKTEKQTSEAKQAGVKQRTSTANSKIIKVQSNHFSLFSRKFLRSTISKWPGAGGEVD